MDNRIFYKLSYGLYVVSSVKDKVFNGQIANTVFQISSEPATIAISINRNNLTHEFIKESGIFTVSILTENVPMNYIGHFGFKSGRDINKFTGVKYELSKKGVPYTTEYSGGWIEAEVIEKIDVETHTVFIGKVLDGEVLGEDEPLTYANYHRIKKGQRLTAAVVTKETDSKTDKVSDKILYRCNICGYVYDMETGDPSSNVLPGTPFEDIDDEWVCPVCGVSKKNFEKI